MNTDQIKNNSGLYSCKVKTAKHKAHKHHSSTILGSIQNDKPVTLDAAPVFNNHSLRHELAKKKLNQKNISKIQKLDKEEKKYKLPSHIYRFVAKEDLKEIKRNGIKYDKSEGDLGGIPFLVLHKDDNPFGIAKAVGVVSTDYLLAVKSDLLPQPPPYYRRNDTGVTTVRLQCDVPREAIIKIISEKKL